MKTGIKKKSLVLIFTYPMALLFLMSNIQILASYSNYSQEGRIIKTRLQGIEVSGQVTDGKGNPLPGVTIRIKGTQRGTTTDESGQYSIMVERPGAILRFSYVGYIGKEVPVGNQTTLNVSLQEDVLGLEEVVT